MVSYTLLLQQSQWLGGGVGGEEKEKEKVERMVRSVKLNSGFSFPILGMGTVALSESQQQVKDALLTAIQVQWVFLFPP